MEMKITESVALAQHVATLAVTDSLGLPARWMWCDIKDREGHVGDILGNRRYVFFTGCIICPKTGATFKIMQTVHVKRDELGPGWIAENVDMHLHKGGGYHSDDPDPCEIHGVECYTFWEVSQSQSTISLEKRLS